MGRTETTLPDNVRNDMLSRAKKRGTGKRKQTEIPGTERQVDEELDAAAEALRSVRAERMELQVEESAAALKLRDLLKDRKLDQYVYEDAEGAKRRASLVPGEDRVSVRKIREPKATPAEAVE